MPCLIQERTRLSTVGTDMMKIISHAAAAAATSSYAIHTNWYTDNGATDHITSELEKLSIRDKYNGEDQIHTASGKGMKISHIGDSSISTSSHNLHLKNILYVPKAKKNLVSVHQLTTDNSAFVEFHLDFFLIKDQATRRTLLREPCRSGLYPLPPSPSIKHHAYGVSRPSISRWHDRLGHPSSTTVRHIVRINKLPCLDESNNEFVCVACQQEKAHSCHILFQLVSLALL
jgi:hypothetical protein